MPLWFGLGKKLRTLGRKIGTLLLRFLAKGLCLGDVNTLYDNMRSTINLGVVKS
jgi:hypothetical protein